MKYKILWTIFLFFIASIETNKGIAAPPVYIDNINDAVALSESDKKDLLIIFGASWCKHCVRMKNDIQSNENIVQDTIVCYLDIEKNKEVASEYRVKNIPDYILLKNKVEVKRRVGYENIKKFAKWLKE